MKIFPGSSNNQLVEAVSQVSGVPVGKIELSRFINTETRVHIKETSVDEVVIVQSFSTPVDRHIVQFCLIADALKRMGSTSITAVIPYLGYSKQDKVFRSGEPLSVKVVANIIQTLPIKKVITFDLHNPAIMGFFDIPLINIKAMPLFVDYFSSKVGQEQYCVISPDAGAVKTSTEFANQLNIPIAYINKKRDLETGEVSIVDIDRDISGYHCIILDDMIATGSTMLSIGSFLKSKGVKTVTIGATHHLYLEGVQEQLDHSAIDQVVVTNSIQKPTQVNSPKLVILGLENLLASHLT